MGIHCVTFWIFSALHLRDWQYCGIIKYNELVKQNCSSHWLLKFFSPVSDKCKKSDQQLIYVGFEVFTAVVMKSIIWDVTCLLAGSCWNFLLPWRWRRYVPPKRRLHLNRLHGVTSQKMILFSSWSVTSKPTVMIPSNFIYVWTYPWENIG
jgi:hypothetical protein